MSQTPRTLSPLGGGRGRSVWVVPLWSWLQSTPRFLPTTFSKSWTAFDLPAELDLCAQGQPIGCGEFLFPTKAAAGRTRLRGLRKRPCSLSAWPRAGNRPVVPSCVCVGGGDGQTWTPCDRAEFSFDATTSPRVPPQTRGFCKRSWGRPRPLSSHAASSEQGGGFSGNGLIILRILESWTRSAPRNHSDDVITLVPLGCSVHSALWCDRSWRQ